jgi:hypothetical protein
LLRYGVAWHRSRAGLGAGGGDEVVAGDRLGLRAAVLVVRELVDDVRRVGVDVEVEHLPAAVRGLADDKRVPGATGVAIAPDR